MKFQDLQKVPIKFNFVNKGFIQLQPIPNKLFNLCNY